MEVVGWSGRTLNRMKLKNRQNGGATGVRKRRTQYNISKTANYFRGRFFVPQEQMGAPRGAFLMLREGDTVAVLHSEFILALIAYFLPFKGRGTHRIKM